MPQTQAISESPAFDLTDLDAMLSDAVSNYSRGQSITALQRKPKPDQQKPTQITYSNSHSLWRTEALVAVWRQVSCICGMTYTDFSHFAYRQTYPYPPKCKRLVRLDNHSISIGDSFDGRKLLHETIIIKSQVPLCAHCALESGWDLASAEVLTAIAP